ncbi:MAG: TonB-dependent receptor domain-containing protein [Rhodothermaceae bacterium]
MKFDSKFSLKIKVLSILIILLSTVVFSQTGKISGNVKDKSTGEALIGVNVIIKDHNWGAATDISGDYSIINIPPGKYTLIFQMMGYQKTVFPDVVVNVNRTTTIDVELSETDITLGSEVVVTASKVSMKKDQTSSVRNVTTDQIKALPVENLTDIVNMQSGVVAGHFRGGRKSEVTYMVDGLIVDDSFSKTSRDVEVETDVIAEVEVITGTFNAEYGNAMSGIVNAITKDGSNKFEGSASIGASNYFTGNKNIFLGLKDDDFTRNTDFKLNFSGPILKNTLSFIVNGRYQNKDGYLNGIRLFRPDDYSYFKGEESGWRSDKSGDSSFVAMNTSETYSLYSKISFKPFAGFRSAFTYSRNSSEWQNYSHAWKYNPDGRNTQNETTDMYALMINHSLSKKVFYELKASLVDKKYTSWFYENPLDDRYISADYYRFDPGFLTGGQDHNWTEQNSKKLNLKFDFTWQIDKNHILKTGVSYLGHDFKSQWISIQNAFDGTGKEHQMVYDSTLNKYVFPNFKPEVRGDSTAYASRIHAKPFELAFYVQDKMEFDNLVINAGLRLDYFDPNTVAPSDWRNPANQIRFDDPNSEKYSTYNDVDASWQLSPRLGLSYQLGEAALLRFSYGHFFQMPPLSYLYSNPTFQVSPFDLGTLMGNPELKPQKTVQYEVGLWQQIGNGMSVEVAVYYRDIYDLLGTKIVSTYNQIRYGLYTNLDYGNVKGLEIKYDYFVDNFSFFLNYTLQYTRGNADRPDLTFSRAGDKLDPVTELYRMSWDQRHTLNASVNYKTADYGVTLTGYFNSGTPYTWRPTVESQLYKIKLNYNNSVKPSKFQADLRAYYQLVRSEDFGVRLSLLVYNLFDSLLENEVNETTGRAYSVILRPHQVAAHKSDFNDAYDWYKNPTMYGQPREIKLMLDVNF